jgi:hypothetical protein
MDIFFQKTNYYSILYICDFLIFIYDIIKGHLIVSAEEVGENIGSIYILFKAVIFVILLLLYTITLIITVITVITSTIITCIVINIC